MYRFEVTSYAMGRAIKRVEVEATSAEAAEAATRAKMPAGGIGPGGKVKVIGIRRLTGHNGRWI